MTGDGPFRIGMIGAGTVGGGVYELIMDRLRSATPQQRPILITKICVRDLDKPRSFTIDEAVTTMTTDVDSILHDEAIDMIVEVMGGTRLAKDIVFSALRSKKHVVTANKALIAEHMTELEQLLPADVAFGYEAAVCGGIPIIRTLQQAYVGDIVESIQGICNGTTNYMLSKLEKGDVAYDDVLKEAQDLGYAEADPTADVEGHDVRAKIAILAKLAFGVSIEDLHDIPCHGISQLTRVDFAFAKSMGCTIKLLGTAERSTALSVYVSACIVPSSHVLASIGSNGNGVAVKSANMGQCCYMGPGAGRFATANSVVADICRMAHEAPSPAFPKPSTIATAIDHDFVHYFYVRIPCAAQIAQSGNTTGVIAKVEEIARSHGISVATVSKDHPGNVCLTTASECSYSQIRQLCAAFQSESYCVGDCVFLPVLGAQ